MSNTIMALLGISGVGKSTALGKLIQFVPFQHLQASSIIKEVRAKIEAEPLSNDDLRKLSIDDNQQLLIQGLQDALLPTPRLAILDGHSVIETPSGIVLIEPYVFQNIGVQEIIFFADNPALIAERRRNDQSRKRPPAKVQDVATLQDSALMQAAVIARQLDIAMSVLKPSHSDRLTGLLAQFA